MKRLILPSAILLAIFFSLSNIAIAQTSHYQTVPNRQATYCNPINIDYGFCPIPNFVQNGKHRATADPIMSVYDNKYFMFSTNQWGYWWSSDMKDWKFVSRKFLRPWE
jgi:hypothetical protein